MLSSYWHWTGGNIGALPLEALVTALAGLVFRKRIRRWYERARDRALRPLHDHLAEIRKTADAAHRINADLYLHHIGKEHPDAPNRRM